MGGSATPHMKRGLVYPYSKRQIACENKKTPALVCEERRYASETVFVTLFEHVDFEKIG